MFKEQKAKMVKLVENKKIKKTAIIMVGAVTVVVAGRYVVANRVALAEKVLKSTCVIKPVLGTLEEVAPIVK